MSSRHFRSQALQFVPKNTTPTLSIDKARLFVPKTSLDRLGASRIVLLHGAVVKWGSWEH